eukprot:jgi/Ulvmu1/3357/UM156_0014.1
MRDSPTDAMPPVNGKRVSSWGSHTSGTFLATGDQAETATASAAPALPSTMPVLTSTAEPSAPPLPQPAGNISQDIAHGLPSAHERAQSNDVVERQLLYISNGPFDEGLKEILWQDVLQYATPTVDRQSTAPSPEPRAMDADIRFDNDMIAALRISENTYQPNDPNVQPLVGDKQPIAHLISTCQHKPALKAKLEMLLRHFSQYRPILGDGNCFYRSYAFGMIEYSVLAGWQRFITFKEKLKSCTVAAQTWVWKAQALDIPGHASFKARSDKLLKDGYVKFRELKDQVERAGENVDPMPLVLEFFQGVMGNSVMHLIRQLAAYEMLAHEDQYATFLPAIEGPLRTVVPYEQLTVPLVVGRLVVADGVEAEHVMIQAIATLLGLCLAVVYADGQADPKVHIISSQREHVEEGEPSMFLLFRDGHYDLIYPINNSWRCLVAQTGTVSDY